MRRFGVCLLLLLAVLVVLGGPARAEEQYKTRHVILAVMDGVRWMDSFGDPTHALIPHLYNDLRPQGTLFTHYYNRGVTITQAAQSTIATGTWQCVPNNGPRMTMPSLFEYYRDQTGASAGKAWVVFGPEEFAFKPYSSFPGYGAELAPSYVFGAKGDPINDFSTAGDEGVLAKVLDVMKTDQPDIILVDFAYTDQSGHTSKDIDGYKAAVKGCDEILGKLWDGVQADPNYRDTTTVFFANDHGRHTTDYHSHGDHCDGCEHIMLLALGPDIKKGEVVDKEALQIDLVPTAGELLGIQTPLATGRVLTECMTENLGLNKKVTVTPRAVKAQETVALAARDLVKVAADYTLGNLPANDVPGDLGGQMLALGMARAYTDKHDERYLDWARQWIDIHKDSAEAATQVAVGNTILQLPERAREAYLPLAKAYAEKPAALAPPANRNAALAAGTFLGRLGQVARDQTYARAGQAVANAALSLPWPSDAMPQHLALIGEALSVYPKDTDLAKAAAIASYISLCWLKEPGGLWEDPTAVGLYAYGMQAGAACMRGVTEKMSGRSLPASLEAITDDELTALFPDQLEERSRRLKTRMGVLLFLRGKQGLPFTIDAMRYGVNEAGAYGDGSAQEQGGFLMAYKPLQWRYDGNAWPGAPIAAKPVPKQ
jgi:hypothetical protein